jgi:hypothetical protein
MQTWCRDDVTLGTLEYDNFRCFTLERPWLNNKKYVSCIPPGEYTIQKHISPTHGPCFWILNVPGRTEILIHRINFRRDTKGCVGVGDSITYLDNNTIPDLTNSAITLKQFLKVTPSTTKLLIERTF